MVLLKCQHFILSSLFLRPAQSRQRSDSNYTYINSQADTDQLKHLVSRQQFDMKGQAITRPFSIFIGELKPFSELMTVSVVTIKMSAIICWFIIFKENFSTVPLLIGHRLNIPKWSFNIWSTQLYLNCDFISKLNILKNWFTLLYWASSQ